MGLVTVKLGQIEPVNVGFLISHFNRSFLIASPFNQHFKLIQAFKAELSLVDFIELVVAVNDITLGSFDFDWPTVIIEGNNDGSQQLIRMILTRRCT